MKKLIVFLFVAGIVALTVLCGQTSAGPLAKHPNLARANALISRAYERIVDAQKANEFDLGGHAAKAKTYLEEAKKELQLAAVKATENRIEDKEGREIEGGTHEKVPAESAQEIRHPNIRKAQLLIDNAYERIADAQKANEFDLGGHAEKAKGLLEEATKELKAAAVEANH